MLWVLHVSKHTSSEIFLAQWPGVHIYVELVHLYGTVTSASACRATFEPIRCYSCQRQPCGLRVVGTKRTVVQTAPRSRTRAINGRPVCRTMRRTDYTRLLAPRSLARDVLLGYCTAGRSDSTWRGDEYASISSIYAGGSLSHLSEP